MRPILSTKQKIVKPLARVMFVLLWVELLLPAQQALALTSGPTTPEMSGFEPIGTTDMVNTFSGDFVYNLPLFDLEGYPVNMAYHSGVGMEDEASWVGLGWSLNTGQINRGVRGIPDDYNGEEIHKKLHINKEKNYVFNAGVNIGFEVAGFARLGLGVDVDVTYNNYKGYSAGLNTGLNIGFPKSSPSNFSGSGVGINVGTNSQSGADINTTINVAVNKIANSNNGGSISLGTGFNSRYGMKDPNMGISVYKTTTKTINTTHQAYGLNRNKVSSNEVKQRSTLSTGSAIPIGLQNYTPAITNAVRQAGYSFRVQVGLEAMLTYPHFNLGMTYSHTDYEQDGTKKAYGYLHLQNADKEAILDFTRDKDGAYNKTHASLPTSALSYDVFSVNGQGTGGMFRPFRNDIGSIYDPEIVAKNNQNSTTVEVGGPIGVVGGLFELGANHTLAKSVNKSGAGHDESLYNGGMYKFRKRYTDHNYENVYFKNGGELTYNKNLDEIQLGGIAPVMIDNKKISNNNGQSFTAAGNLLSPKEQRTPRATSYNYLTQLEAGIEGIGMMPKLLSYPMNTLANMNTRVPGSLPRGLTPYFDKMKADHIGEFYQTMPDGRRYIFALPAVNRIQREATFSVKDTGANILKGITTFSAAHDKMENGINKDAYFQLTMNPAHAYAYQLTAVLSPDYVDITGDGPTEDDIGSYTRFNYTLAEPDYRWITPYSQDGNLANYHPGNLSDKNDDKASYIIGSKEVWYVSTIESKNQIAEFYVSKRNDARGTKASVVKTTDGLGAGKLSSTALTSLATAEAYSYKLDSVVVYMKNDRFTNGNNAVPLKTVVFEYDYSLCPGVTNNLNGGGKLTLNKLYVKHGNSRISLLNPYEFTYGAGNAIYDVAHKDRWGNFKPQPANPGELAIYDFPYTKQVKADADNYIANWHLTSIKLPSGAKLDIEYESDDYSYVQDKRAMEMIHITGVGNSSNYLPTDELYTEPTEFNNYIFIKRHKQRESSALTLAQNYLEDQDLIYFSFRVDIGNRSKFEHIKGYAMVDAVGVCPNNDDYLFIKLKGEKAGTSTTKEIHPISLAALNYAKLSLPQLIYPGYKEEDDDSNLRTILDGLSGALEEMKNLFKNQNLFLLEERKLCKKIDPNHSWVRMNSPGYTKLGGGIRVKSLVLSDEWNSMSQSYNSTYGKKYDYTTISDKTGERISSGVAINEPAIGGDENPLRQPEPYTAQSGRLVPPVEMFKETPHAESYLPGASVGYSKVTVQSIHVEDAKSSKYESVQEFYTAKDFPVRIEQTPIKELKSKKINLLLRSESSKSVAQGYAVIMNDMHGKQKATADYVIRTTGSIDNAKREELSSQQYIYQTDASGKLNNKVKALLPPDATYANYRIDSVALGQEIDINHDVRYTNNLFLSIAGNANINAVNFLFVTIPLPTFFSIQKTKEDEFTSQVTTKFVQQYGLIKKVITHNHGAKVVQENLLYDAQTGNALHAVTNNEFNDKINTVNIPAYLAHNFMEPAYINEGMVFTADSMYIKKDGFLRPNCNYNFIKEGDELMLTYQRKDDLNKRYAIKMWVVGVQEFPGHPTGVDTGIAQKVIYPALHTNHIKQNPPANITQPGAACKYIVLQPRVTGKVLGTSITNWTNEHNNGYVYNIEAKIIRSGNRNHLNPNVQELSFVGNKAINAFNDLFNFTAADKIINTSVALFDNTTQLSLRNFGSGGAVYNDFVSGKKGNVKSRNGYVYNSGRQYNNNARYDGTYGDYASFWEPIASQTACNMYRNVIKKKDVLSAKWKTGDSVMTYNTHNLPTQTKTANGIISSGIYGFNYTLPILLGQNAYQRELAFYHFEDDKYFMPQIFIDDDYYTQVPLFNNRNSNAPVTYTTLTAIIRYGRQFTSYNTDYFYPGFALSSQAHTGKYALQVIDISKKIFITNASTFIGDKKYKLSYWLRNANLTKPTLGSIIIRCFNTSSQVYSDYAIYAGTQQITTGPIDGWYKVEAELTDPWTYIPAGLTPIAVELKFASTNQLMDDIRFAPVNASCVGYVYNPFTLRLMAQLDNNNYATFYEYDAEGNMIRTKKETDNGILTINENRKSYSK